ncbi:MAG: methyltransferase, TrmH family [Actinomycetota bacterium]|nr:methyltransferase, TrmH family [Actinomycetota bacterium]
MEGFLQLQAALDAGAEILEVFLEESEEGSGAERLCAAHGLRCYRVDAHVGRALAGSGSSPGVVSMVRSPGVGLDDLPETADLVVVLAEVRDPGNAGTLIRSAAAAGADAVVFSTRAVDPLGGKAVRSAAGAIFRIPLVLNVPLEPSLWVLRERGLSIVATDAHGPTAPDGYDMTQPTVLVLGNEARGLPPDIADVVDHVVTIPMPGSGESLNVAAAGSILLFEAVRQRRDAAEKK